MKQRPWSVLLWLIFLIIFVGLACSFPSGDEEPTEVPAAQVDEPKEPEASEEEAAPESGAVTSYQDARGAVIQIEAQGVFVDPEWGEYSGAGRGSGSRGSR